MNNSGQDATANIVGITRRVRSRTHKQSPQHGEIRQWIAFACDRCKCPELAHRIVHSFNHRLRRAVGLAKAFFVNGVPDRLRIELATKRWRQLNDVGQRNTVIHEACHLIVFYTFGSNTPGHGCHWKWAMGRCDTPPDICLVDYEIKEEWRPSQKFIPPGLVLARCGCTGHRKVPIGQARLIRSGERFRCDVCRRHLALVFG